MKSISSLFTAFAAAIALMFVLAPAGAEAGHGDRYQQTHSCHQCQAPVYAQLRVVGHYPCGDPIYRWVPVKHQCAGGHGGHGGHHDHGAHYGHPGAHDPYRGGYRGRPGIPRPDIGHILGRIFDR